MNLKSGRKLEDIWDDIQAYYEVREWKKYRKTAQMLEEDLRDLGEIKLADEVKRLMVAAKEENKYYIDAHQSELVKECQKLLGQQKSSEFYTEVEKMLQNPTEWVLLVDDDKKSIKQAEQILSDYVNVAKAESVAEALQIMKEKQPDLLMIDVFMPETDGLEMMGLLKQDPRLCDIPVIFLTTNYDRDMEVRGFNAGAQDFIKKPFIPEITIRRVTRILELSRLQKNLQREVEKQTRQAEERRMQVERLSDQIIHALAETIDAKDSYTNGHSKRVAQYSVEIAKRAGKSQEAQEHIHYMGMLHDIGKIGIPDSIITKNSSLSDKEYFVTRKHPEIGAEILSNISEIPDLAVGARWHHERYDGTGYPDGLVGEAIPEEARIIAVADAYDAMASKRSYRDVLPQQVVYQEIQKGRGTQFDPVFADIMLELMEEDEAYDMREK